MARRLQSAVFIAALILPLVSTAGTPEEVVAAEAAFEEGMALMAQGKYDEACPRLEEAQRLDAGMATQFRIAECYEGAGRLASAWSNFIEVAEAASRAGLQEREDSARGRANALQPRLPKLTIQVPPSVAAVSGLAITQNGKAVPKTLWGVSFPVDPGTVRVEAAAPSRSPWSTEVEATQSNAVVVEIPADLWPADAQAEGTTSGLPPRPPPGESSGMSGQAIAGIVVAATGLVAMGVGIAVGLTAQSHWDESNDQGHCTDNFCDPEGLSIRDDARGTATISTVVFVIGSVALVGGGVLWLTAPSEPEEATAAHLRFGVTPTGFQLAGTW